MTNKGSLDSMNNILLLGSKSYSRKLLLDYARIPYQIVEQEADESQCDWNLPMQQVVENIALYKMNHVIMPKGTKEGDIAFVLTADTLSQERDGTISGKPTGEQDAIDKIRRARAGMRTGTGFCLDRRVWRAGNWEIEQRIQQYVEASYIFAIPEEWVERYMQNTISLNASGAIAIEEYGAQFLKEVQGSYTAIVGLPLFEVREALEKLGFF
jgi:septum formation protein